jgi:hypothetical protein
LKHQWWRSKAAHRRGHERGRGNQAYVANAARRRCVHHNLLVNLLAIGILDPELVRLRRVSTLSVDGDGQLEHRRVQRRLFGHVHVDRGGNLPVLPRSI